MEKRGQEKGKQCSIIRLKSFCLLFHCQDVFNDLGFFKQKRARQEGQESSLITEEDGSDGRK